MIDPITCISIPPNRLYTLTDNGQVFNFNISTLIKIIKLNIYDVRNPYTRTKLDITTIDDIISKYNMFSHLKLDYILECYMFNYIEYYVNYTYYTMYSMYLIHMKSIKIMWWIYSNQYLII